jgi:hypothetical protein
MKKQYFTPEMEELELDGPVVLDIEKVSSCDSFLPPACPYETCGADTCETEE